MPAAIIATQLTTPDTTRSYTINVGPGADVTGDVQFDSLEFEDQGTSAQGTTGFRINGKLVNFPQVTDQALVSIYDHVSDSQAYRGFVDSRHPARIPGWDQIEVTSSDHTSLLDNVIPLESRPAGESDAARIGYLWGLYAGPFLQGSMALVQTINSNMPAQIFASVSLRQALDLIAAQSSTSAVWYLDSTGRLHFFASETNDAPYDITSDSPGAGEIAPLDLDIDYDSKNYISAVYVRGKTDAGSGWVYSASAKLAHNGLQRTGFLDAPDCTTAAMRNALGNMYLGRVGNAINRGSFTAVSPDDGWRAGQNVTVRSTHLGNVNQAFRIARVRTSVLGPASNRQYAVEFGGARAGMNNGSGGPVVGSGIVGDILDDQGNLLLGSGNDASTSGFGPAMRHYIVSGVYNGDFALTPPLEDGSITGAYNPLPFWTGPVWVSGTNGAVQNVADSTTGSGRSLAFSMPIAGAGVDGEIIYLEQIVPVGAAKAQTLSYVPVATITTGSSVDHSQVYFVAQYLKADGVTTTGNAGGTGLFLDGGALGANVTYDWRLAGTTAPNSGGGIPADAYFLRLRVGYWALTSGGGGGVGFTLNQVRLDPGTSAFVPAGTIFAYGAATAPTGFLLCDGSSYVRTTYPLLFAAIGTTYGSADGSHFNVPDLRDKIVVGGTPGTGGGTISPAAALTTHAAHGTHQHRTAYSGSGYYTGWGAVASPGAGSDIAVVTTAASGPLDEAVSGGTHDAHAIYKNVLVSWIIKT